MICFFVPGIPVAKGSAKAFVVKSKKDGKPRAVVTQTNNAKQAPWSSAISGRAQEIGLKPSTDSMGIKLTFQMPRPKNHYGSGKNANTLKADAPTFHTSAPDIDKLIRLCLDALTGVAWMDDRQVVIVRATKMYHAEPGVMIELGIVA